MMSRISIAMGRSAQEIEVRIVLHPIAEIARIVAEVAGRVAVDGGDPEAVVDAEVAEADMAAATVVVDTSR